MTKDEVKSRFLTLSPNGKMKWLSVLAHDLTICARSAYLPEMRDDRAREKLHGLNELVHLLTGQLTHMIAGDTLRYPDDVFLEVLIEKAQAGQCENDLFQMFELTSSSKLPESAA